MTLADIGKRLGREALARVACVAKPETILAWYRKLIARKFDGSKHRDYPGRPRIAPEIEALIVRFARENSGWGYDRIAGALSNLGHQVSDQTVGNVLRRHGIAPAPKRSQTYLWRDFIAAHMSVLSGIDFFTVEVLTWRGLTTYYVLFVIQLDTRRVTVAGVTRHPTAEWMQQMARNITDESSGALSSRRYLIHDRDAKFYIHSHTTVFTLPNIPADLAVPGPKNTAAILHPGAGPGDDEEGNAPRARGTPGGVVPGGGGRGGPGRGGTNVQGLPLIKPPYDRITAYDMNTGEIRWQKTHSSTPDEIRNNPALKGLNLPRLGQPGRTFIGVLTTKTLVIAGEGGVHTNSKGEQVALLRAYDKATGEDIPAEVNMPGKQTGSPMTYLYNGKQYIVVAVTTNGVNGGGELIAYALP